MSGGTDKTEAAVDAVIDRMIAAGLIVRVGGKYQITAKGHEAAGQEKIREA